jgi:hypothetical protein
MRALSEIMPHNKFFKNFASEHQGRLDKKIEKTYGKNSQYSKVLSKFGIVHPFKNKFGDFITEANQFRSDNPKLFEAKNQGDQNTKYQQYIESLYKAQVVKSPKKSVATSLRSRNTPTKDNSLSSKQNSYQKKSDVKSLSPSDIRRIK